MQKTWLQSDQIYCTDGPSARGEITVQGIQLNMVTSGQDGPQGPKGACMRIYMHTCYTSNGGV